jgi:hypothetical protein
MPIPRPPRDERLEPAFDELLVKPPQELFELEFDDEFEELFELEFEEEFDALFELELDDEFEELLELEFEELFELELDELLELELLDELLARMIWPPKAVVSLADPAAPTPSVIACAAGTAAEIVSVAAMANDLRTIVCSFRY